MPVCVGRIRETKKQTLDDEFHAFFPTPTFFAVPVYYLREVFKAHLQSIWK